MQIVIDIPIDTHYHTKKRNVSESDIKIILEAISKGVPLPKGHGKIIDENKITKCEQVGLIIKDGNATRCLVTDAPTIIEADKESE